MSVCNDLHADGGCGIMCSGRAGNAAAGRTQNTPQRRVVRRRPQPLTTARRGVRKRNRDNAVRKTGISTDATSVSAGVRDERQRLTYRLSVRGHRRTAAG